MHQNTIERAKELIATTHLTGNKPVGSIIDNLLDDLNNLAISESINKDDGHITNLISECEEMLQDVTNLKILDQVIRQSDLKLIRSSFESLHQKNGQIILRKYLNDSSPINNDAILFIDNVWKSRIQYGFAQNKPQILINNSIETRLKIPNCDVLQDLIAITHLLHQSEYKVSELILFMWEDLLCCWLKSLRCKNARLNLIIVEDEESGLEIALNPVKATNDSTVLNELLILRDFLSKFSAHLMELKIGNKTLWDWAIERQLFGCSLISLVEKYIFDEEVSPRCEKSIIVWETILGLASKYGLITKVEIEKNEQQQDEFVHFSKQFWKLFSDLNLAKQESLHDKQEDCLGNDFLNMEHINTFARCYNEQKSKDDFKKLFNFLNEVFLYVTSYRDHYSTELSNDLSFGSLMHNSLLYLAHEQIFLLSGLNLDGVSLPNLQRFVPLLKLEAANSLLQPLEKEKTMFMSVLEQLKALQYCKTAGIPDAEIQNDHEMTKALDGISRFLQEVEHKIRPLNEKQKNKIMTGFHDCFFHKLFQIILDLEDITQDGANHLTKFLTTLPSRLRITEFNTKEDTLLKLQAFTFVISADSLEKITASWLEGTRPFARIDIFTPTDLTCLIKILYSASEKRDNFLNHLSK
ncbi:hypothetical protein Ciccas_000127 [Cichlidogyrus casuarinus]|uniref:ZW10 C-terminal helical domain-containing protein n=1 Tax=Cichlidogyrus casuarinus TaxID=1844966 RepID=A0ABD2QP84_9PLAT